MTSALVSLKKSSHIVPHRPLCRTSIVPLSGYSLPTSLTPWTHLFISQRTKSKIWGIIPIPIYRTLKDQNNTSKFHCWLYFKQDRTSSSTMLINRFISLFFFLIPFSSKLELHFCTKNDFNYCLVNIRKNNALKL